MAFVITVALEKGGVGKSNTVVNLALLMAKDGYRTLVVDMDPQANSTFYLTGSDNSAETFAKKGVADMLRVHGYADPSMFVSTTPYDNLSIIPSNGATTSIPKLIDNLADSYEGASKNSFLAACLAEIAGDYDFIIIDTPPSRDLLTLSALYASDYVLLPCKCDMMSVKGLQTTYEIVRRLCEAEDIEIKILGIVLTIVERSTSMTQIIRDELMSSAEYGRDLLLSEIRKGQAVNDSTRIGAPVIACARSSAPAKDYAELYKEIMKKIAKLENQPELLEKLGKNGK